MRSRLLPALVLSIAFLAAACTDTDQGLIATKSNGTPTATDPGSTDGTDGSNGTSGPETTGTDSTGTDSTGPDTTDPETTDPGTGTTGVGDGGNPQDAFGWQDYFGDGTVDSGQLEVPIDYTDPSKGTFTLNVARHNAAKPNERIGALLVNRGGPGFESADFALYADQIYSKDLVDHFDIVAWDPRGTGLSTPAIDCVTDYDKYFATPDITPDDDAERQENVDLSKEFEDDCATKNADILQFIGTNNTARDMDSIRQALGEEQISYFGFSYGSELGATWATLFPDTVRAAVLDGASDPQADFITSSLQQNKGFEDALNNFLADCSSHSDCPFNNGGDAEDAFDALMKSLDENPVPSTAGRPDINLSVALSAVVEAMYSESSWPTLAQGLADAADGNGQGLLDLYDEYFQRQPDGSYDNSLEAFQTITCMDTSERLTVEQADATVPDFMKNAPRLAPSTVGPYFCTFFPPTDDPRVEITGAGAGTILVVGTTGDPATPLASSQNMANDLEDGVLLTVVGNQHTGYDVNECSMSTVDSYLIDKTVPPEGTRCG
jgi:pimeloyl-ACP methyl ester carboxylesterase